MHSSGKFSYWEYLFLRIGLAIGPRTWFGDRYGNNVSHSGTVIGNSFSGAFSYAIGVTSAQNFTIQGNFLSGSTSFIGARGPNCSSLDTAPSPAPWILDPNTTDSSFIQTGFEDVPGADSLICIVPPDGGDFWPFKQHSLVSRATILMAGFQQTLTSGGGVAGIVICILLGLICFFIAAFIAAYSIWIKLRKRKESGELHRFWLEYWSCQLMYSYSRRTKGLFLLMVVLWTGRIFICLAIRR